VVSSGQSKVGQFAGHALVSDKHILWLQVPVVDTDGMAVLYSIQNLEKSTLGHGIIANELALLGDVGEQITFWAVLNHNIRAIRCIHDLDQRHHVWVGTGLMMELDLTLLELSLARLKTNLVQCFYGIWNVGVDVHGSVNNSISSNTEDSGELQSSSQDLA